MDPTSEFPGLGRGTYLNSCAHGLLPRRARRAIELHLDKWEGAPEWEAWTDAAEKARAAFARFIGARPEEIAIQASASTGISSVTSAHKRGRLVTLDIDFPTSGFIARRQTTRGLSHDHLSLGNVRPDEWSKHVRGAALASIPAVASFNGYRLDVREFAQRAHAAEVPLMVDAFQACGTYPIDVKKLDVDFLVTGVYKWLMAPAGLAFLYVRPDHHALVPTVGGWSGGAAPYAFVAGGVDDLAPDARRFQYGGQSVLGTVAIVETLALLSELGLANVERHNRALVERVMTHARERKWEVLTPDAPEERASIVTFRVPDLQRALDACKREGVMVNSRLGGIRASPHFYNRERDVDRLFEVLDAA